jgi:hypothetical protein
VLDFHGQRMTYISGLARAGVSPTKAQKLARHSDVNLTLRTYTHLKPEELASAVESLPSLRGKNLSEEKNEGHDFAADNRELQGIIYAWPKLSADARTAIAAIVTRGLSEQGKRL